MSRGNVSSPLIIALDYPDAEAALAMADQLDPARVRVKVGKELFTREGPAVVRALHERGFQVFLDLKFHDIPNTVAGAVRAAAEMGVWMVNVHASGGETMMKAAMEAARDYGEQRPLVTAVTVLTSMSAEDLVEVGVERYPLAQVTHLARLAWQCRLDGVVCSGREAADLRQLLGQDFLLVSPGIRPKGADKDDQSRIVTPEKAREVGVSYMVIGRPVTRAESPTEAVEKIIQSLA